VKWWYLNKFETTYSRRLDIEQLQHQLDTQCFGLGKRLVYIPKIDSTNTQAIQLAHQGAEEGVVVLTESQTAGKGRQGRRWVDIYGLNALVSTILRPLFPPYLLVMIAALAVVDAISDVCGLTATIKWPNDILIADRKVAGILIETSHDRFGHMIAVVGIGVNVNGRIEQAAEYGSGLLQTDPALTAKAISLETAWGHTVSRESFIARLLYHLEVRYLALQQEMQDPVAAAYGTTSRLIREQWRSQLSTLGRLVEVHQGTTLISGFADDVNDTGELLLRSHSGTQINVTWGDIGYPTE